MKESVLLDFFNELHHLERKVATLTKSSFVLNDLVASLSGRQVGKERQERKLGKCLKVNCLNIDSLMNT